MDKKSLRVVLGRTADWKELAKDCVAFANAHGGRLLIGIEDADDVPPSEQRIPADLPDTIRKKVDEQTVNVFVLPQVAVAENGGQYIELTVSAGRSVASTTDGRFFIRVSDGSKPVVGEEILRLAGERAAFPWETLTSMAVPRDRLDREKLRTFCDSIRASDRVKQSVKEKTDDELLAHYLLADGPWLTNLGVLCVGRREDRARLGSAPVVQFIKYDEKGKKINKLTWDDYSLNPMELVAAIWAEIPDWRESYEFPDGLYRQRVPHYDATVVRELLINALVHRPYTQRGDIFINLYPDRMQIVNPGLLPLGVTPRNILHASVRRNEHLAKVFHDLGLMEREGSGYDAVYETLLSQGKQLPEIEEGADYFSVTVQRRVFNLKIIDFIAKADATYQLSQREKICLGLLAQQEALLATELCRLFDLKDTASLKPWLGHLVEIGLVQSRGRTKGTTYRIAIDLIRQLNLKTKTTLRDIQPYRLRQLVIADLEKYQQAAIGELHARIGSDIPRRSVQRTLAQLVAEGKIKKTGRLKQTRYHWLTD